MIVVRSPTPLCHVAATATGADLATALIAEKIERSLSVRFARFVQP